ncbi:Spy0128 family protein [Streptococcus parasanguinis]|uniref:Spy0128 family protein n=1 Tax=Streptococcus parasanguinis TaxID=1318 RepID=UPI0011DE02E4|nr:FctA domain-containing protein [Streptococcus parasanguinis]
MKNIFSDSKERFSIRKYTIGVASVLLSTLVFVEGNVYADEVKNNTDSQISVVAQENQGERYKESGLEANEVVTQASTSVTPSESALPTSQASAEAPAHVVKGEKTEKQSNEVATPASTSVAPAESASPTSKASAEGSVPVASEKKTESQPTTRSRRSKRELPSSGGTTTYEKTGDTITVKNPNVEVNFPNGNSLYAPAETVIHMELPDELEIKQNDKVVVDIPDAIRIPTSLHYDVTGPSGEIIGNAFLDSISNKVITTFTDYYEKNKIAKQFTLTFSTGWKSYVKPNVPTELNFSGRKITVTVGPESAPVPVEKTKVTKYGEAVTGHPELIRWTIRLNSGSLVAPQVLTNYQLIDTLPDDQVLVQDGDPVLDEFDTKTKETWRLGLATSIPSDNVDLWNGKALRAERVQSITPWVSKGNAIQLLENIKESPTGFSFKIAQLNELVYVRYMTRLKNVPNTNEELQEKHGNNIKITYNTGEEQSYQATFAFKAGGSGSASKAKQPARVDLAFTKRLEGRKLTAGEFTFNLVDQSGNVVDTQKNDSFGHITFIPQLFNYAGVYHYTVEEVPGTEAGINYDAMKAEVSITVDEDGNSYIAHTIMPTDTEFNNTYTPSPVKVGLEFNKVLSNGSLNAGDFSFTLIGDNNVNETVTNKADGKITFSDLSFDHVGVFNYTVKEVKGDKPDVDYDDMTIAVKVTVSKDEETGLLTAKTEMTSTGGEVTGTDDKTFNNYAVAPVTAQFDFSKVLAGRTLKDGEFSFVLKDASGQVLQTKTNDASGKVAFDALTYKNKEVGVHKYTVEEVAGSEAGMTYDPMKAEVTVTVTKDGHTLTATKALPTDTEFNNTFTPAATSAQFKFTKKLEGKALEADAFSFELLENGQVLQTKKNAADGTIQFDAISYDKEGTHTYTVREVAGTDTDIDYDTMNAEVTVKVTKDATTGILTANVVMPADSEFNNYAVAPVTAQFDFSKVLAGRTLKDGEFSFVLKDENGTVLQTKTNDASGKVAFDALTYKNNEVGIHKYAVEEVAGSEAGMSYDPMKAEVTVTVTKDGHTLTATKALPTDTEFNNTFTPAATSAQFKFTKKLEGKALEADAFSFELLENGQVLQTKKNAADGTIQFDAISYDKEGTHTYTVREVVGADTDIDYDSMTIAVKVTVTKDITTGLLSAKTEMIASGGEATGTDDTIFNNYFVAPVKAQFNFTKKLDGRALKAGEFSFILKDEKGNVIETVSNDAEGKIKFSALEFKRGQEGTYIYHVEEVKGTDAGVEYDKMVATVGVTVTKDGKVLTLTSQMPEDTEFNNKVIPPTPVTPPTPVIPVTPPTPPTPPTPVTPEKPKGRELPNTGEQSKSGVAALGAALGLVGLGLVAKRKKEDEA